MQSEANTTQKILSALAYISYFFLPIIFPLVVWIVGAQQPYVKHHAKRAFWSQLLPLLVALLSLLVVGLGGSFNPAAISWGFMTVAIVAITAIVALISLIYNLVWAIRVLIA